MKRIFLFIVFLFFVGCSEKEVIIKAHMPAKVSTLSEKRVIAVIPFNGDNINFSGRLESKLASLKVNGKPYFKVISRDKIDEVLKELRFQSSDLVGNKVARFGKLAGAKILITGNVRAYFSNGKYSKPKERCLAFDKKGRCLVTKTIYITCRTSTANLNVNISAIDVNTAQIVDAVNISKSYEGDSCKGDYMRGEEALSVLADEAVDEYTKRVAPYYTYLRVKLIDDVDSVDLTSKEERMFNNALKYIEDGRLDRAEYLLKRLNERVDEKSYEIAYDLGVVEEALGKFEEAKAAYELADKIILENGEEPNELVDEAIKRINFLIKNQKILKSQI